MARYNLIQSPAVFLIEAFCSQLWGFKPNIVVPLVKQKGAVRSLFWFFRNVLKYESLRERWGPMRTNLLATSISVSNACAYNTFGHGLAMQLAYLKQSGRLFPLTDSELLDLCGHSEEDIVDTLKQALTEADLSSEVLLVQRMSELRRRPELATTRQDRDLVQLFRLFDTLNFCGIKHGVRSDQAHDPINKDRALRDRYFALRASELEAKELRNSELKANELGSRRQSQPAFVSPASVSSARVAPPDVTVLNPADIGASAAVTELDW